MEPKQMFKQMLDFNKTALDSTFNSMIMFQEQAETVGNMFMEKNPLLPEEGKKAVKDWISTYKKGRDDFRKAVDESLNKMEAFVADAGRGLSE
jgi:polyhydroxyalkanoate synthesis regulator phasin